MAQQQQNEEQDINQLLKVRREKLATLQEGGKNPYEIMKYDVTHHSKEIIENFEEFDKKNVSIAGRMMSKRVMGKASFCHIQDLEGRIQCYVARDNIGEEAYAEFKKYDLLDAFWKYVEQQFGFTSPAPTLEKFLISMYVTYADRYIDRELPKGWKGFVSYKSGNIIAFMDNLMNNVLYRDKYDELSAYVSGVLDRKSVV